MKLQGQIGARSARSHSNPAHRWTLEEAAHARACQRSARLVLTLALALPSCTHPSQTHGAPIAAPSPSVLDCVESQPLRDYVLGLDEHREGARRAAVKASGATWDERPQRLLDPSVTARTGETIEIAGERWAVVGAVAPGSLDERGPELPLAKLGHQLRPVAERPQAHPVPLRVCGVAACNASPAHPAGPRAPVRPVLVALAPGEVLGEPLLVRYDVWWAQVSYSEQPKCISGRPVSWRLSTAALADRVDRWP